MKLRAYLLMSLVVAVWGSTFVLIKGALTDATPAAFNLVRMSLAFGLLAIAYHHSWRGIRRSHLAAGAVVGFFLAMGYQFQTIGLVRTTPSKSAFITGPWWCWFHYSRQFQRCVRPTRVPPGGALP